MNVTTAPVKTTSSKRRHILPCSIEIGPFERHGIDHLSASSLNQWITSPALWIMERLLDRRGPPNCAMHRGTAVEAGLAAGLFADVADLAACVDVALAKFDELAARSSDPKRDDERAIVPAMTRQALTALHGLGAPARPEGKWPQFRISIPLEGVTVPLVGFLDFFFPNNGLIVDLKTTLRVPSAWSPAHLRQAAAYQSGHPNSAVAFFYVSDKRANYLHLDRDQAAQGLSELTHAARRLGRFLALSDDPHELAAIVTPDFGTFHWNDPETRRLGRLTYGF